MFFALLAFMLLFTSCSKESILEPNFSEAVIETIETRSNGIASIGNVASVEIIIEDVFIALSNFDTDVENLAVAEQQTIELTNLATGLPEFITVNVSSFEIIIEDVFVAFTVPSIDFGNYEFAEQQTLIFEE